MLLAIAGLGAASGCFFLGGPAGVVPAPALRFVPIAALLVGFGGRIAGSVALGSDGMLRDFISVLSGRRLSQLCVWVWYFCWRWRRSGGGCVRAASVRAVAFGPA